VNPKSVKITARECRLTHGREEVVDQIGNVLAGQESAPAKHTQRSGYRAAELGAFRVTALKTIALGFSFAAAM
jgi:hypothetical protein